MGEDAHAPPPTYLCLRFAAVKDDIIQTILVDEVGNLLSAKVIKDGFG